MTQPDMRDQEIRALRDRLSRLSEASLRITEDLDFNSVLQGVLDSARSLTGARYGVIALHSDEGMPEDFLSSGMTADESSRLWNIPGWPTHFAYLSRLQAPLRLPDLLSHIRSLGLPELLPPMDVSERVSFLAFPVLHRRERVGSIYLAEKEGGREFTREDEETLALFASQAAMAISNARQHREERRARADLETLIDTSPVGVVVFDATTGNPKSLNQEAQRMVDILRDPDQTPEQLLELISFRRADGREISLQEFPIGELLRIGETLLAEEIVMEVPDGRSISVLINATPIRTDEGEVASMIVTMQDMAPLQEMERMRAEFLGMVSHELRAPLTSIRGSATTVLDASSELDPAELRQFLRIIVDQSDSMRELISDLLDVARIETGTLPIGAEPTDVAVLVDRARNTFISGGGRNNLYIDVPTRLPLVLADRRRIVQVINNLLSNASRNSPNDSVIGVSAVQDGIHIAVSVTDEGRGVPAEQLPLLFRKFSQARSDGQGGDTGLGLAICKGIVEAHGGRIWAESEGAGLGTRFTFTIPTVEEAGFVTDTPTAPESDEAEGREPILVVDDDPQTLMYIRSALSESGYTPIVTASAEEALNLFMESRPHLVLLDLMLPGSDGIELMGEILAIADVPVIFVSAYGRDQVIAQAFSKGASDYIVKPFSPTELVARVNAALRRRNVVDQLEPSEPYLVGDLYIDPSERRVRVAGREVTLTVTEYRLLNELSANQCRSVPHDQLLRRVWPLHKSPNLRTLRTHIRRLRRKLGDDGKNPQYILADPRIGYRLVTGETEDSSG